MKKLVKLFLVAITLCPSFALNAQTTVNISNESELKAFRTDVSNGTYGTNGIEARAVITANISLNDPWTPIPTFSGVIDGQFHKISHFDINATTKYQGLVGQLLATGVIKNLGIANGTITSNQDFVGAFAGECKGLIEACWNGANITSSTTIIQTRLGGIAGFVNDGGKIRNCYNTGDISSTSGNGDHVAGIAGGLDNDNSLVENCYNTGTISGKNYIAGIISNLAGNATTTILRNCYNIGTISGMDTWTAAVANKGSGNITNCYHIETYGSGNNSILQTPEELKALYSTLNGSQKETYNGVQVDIWQADNTVPVNNGYPILFYQYATAPINEPVVQTENPTDITKNSVILHGNYEHVNNPTFVGFKYRQGETSWTLVQASATTSPFSASVASLNPSTIYEFKAIVAYNTSDTLEGVTRTFTTLSGTGGIAPRDAENDMTVTLYPNPTTGQLTIQVSDMRYPISDIVIYDMLGRIQKIGYRKSENRTSEIDISHLQAGIYFLQVAGKTVKVVKE